MDPMDKLAGLCKRRGFVFPSSEIYSGLAGFWDYGPLGVELARNIETFWWDYMVRRRDNVVGLDSACIGPEAVWVASGHVGAFNDALIDDKNSKERFRIDQLQYRSEDDAEKAEVFTLMTESILALQRENKDVLWGSMVKQTMQRKKPSFNEGYYGYSTFSELLQDAERNGLIKLRKDERSGSWVVTGFAKKK